MKKPTATIATTITSQFAAIFALFTSISIYKLATILTLKLL